MDDDLDEFYYLEQGFDPNQLTIPKLRSILLKHDVQYPASAKKAVLIDLFNDRIVPQARKLLRSQARTKPSSRGIEDVPSSSGSTVDDTDDQTLVPPPSAARRTSRRTTRASTEEETGRPAGATRRKTPLSTVPTKHGRTPDPDLDERPAARRTRHSVTPAVKEETPEPEAWHRHDDESPFTNDNPFQSGSSPPVPKPTSKERRRITMGVIEQTQKRKHDTNRRRTAHPVEQYDEGVVVPSRKSFEVRSKVLPAKVDEIEPGEEFTPEEQKDLIRASTAAGRTDILPPRKKKSSSSAKGTLKTGAWAVALAALVGLVGFWRQEKLAVGYCGIGQETTSLAGVEIPEWAGPLLPECEPCPPHAYCYKDLETICETDFVLKPHPLSFGGLVPLPPSCEPDSEKARRITAVTDRSIDALRKRRAQYECGEADDTGKRVASPEMSEAELKAQVGSKRRKGMSQEEFEKLWQSAIPEIRSRTEVEQSTDKITGNEVLTSTSYVGLSLKCAFRRWLREALERHLQQFAGVIVFMAAVLYSRYAYISNRAMEARAKELASLVFDRLANQAALNLQEPGAYPDLGISMTHLRDDMLRTEFSAAKRQQLWQRVQKKVEHNSNVRAAIRPGRSGDVGRMWEWVGPVQLIEDVRSTGKRESSRFSLGPVVGTSPPGPTSPETKGANPSTWDEGRPIY